MTQYGEKMSDDIVDKVREELAAAKMGHSEIARVETIDFEMCCWHKCRLEIGPKDRVQTVIETCDEDLMVIALGRYMIRKGLT